MQIHIHFLNYLICVKEDTLQSCLRLGAKLVCWKYAFPCRIVDIWNSLEVTDACASLNGFEIRIYKILHSRGFI